MFLNSCFDFIVNFTVVYILQPNSLYLILYISVFYMYDAECTTAS